MRLRGIIAVAVAAAALVAQPVTGYQYDPGPPGLAGPEGQRSWHRAPNVLWSGWRRDGGPG